MLVTAHVLVGICCGVANGIVALLMIFSKVVEMILFFRLCNAQIKDSHLQASEFLFELIGFDMARFFCPAI
jgi:hypothetical protein